MASESVRIEGLEGVLRTLNALPPAMVSRSGGPVLGALRAAAKVIQRDEIERLNAIIATPNIGGTDYSTGLLAENIRVARGKKPRGGNGETVSVRVRNKAYPPRPGGKGGKKVTTAQVARLLEYGTEKREPMPFIRPAFEAKKHLAVVTFSAEMRKRLDKLVKKVARMNGAKL